MYKMQQNGSSRRTTREESWEEYTIQSCVRGYHVYQEVWTASEGDELICVRQPTNDMDRYAVATLLKGTSCVVGHLPRKLSKLCSCFLRKGGLITCTVNGTRRHSSDLPQGGLELPCMLSFKGNSGLIRKLKARLSDH